MRAQIEPPQSLLVDRTDDVDVRGCSSAPNDCTLRGAMLKAKTTDIIIFDSTVFPHPGNNSVTPTIIYVTSALPPITQGVLTLVGTTSMRPSVIIDGSMTPAGTDGLRITSNGNFVRGIIVRRFPGNGFVLEGNNNTLGGQADWESGCDYTYRPLIAVGNGGWGMVVRGSSNYVGASFFGRDMSGTVSANGAGGVLIESGASTLGDDYSQCFIAQGNTGHGIEVRSAASGTYLAGILARANNGSGILVDGAEISISYISAYGNTANGVSLVNDASGSLSQIYTYQNTGHGVAVTAASDVTLSGSSCYSNGGDGLHVESSSNINFPSTSFYSNTGAGVRVASGDRVRCAGNCGYYNNGGLGFDLVGGNEDTYGVTSNDGGADTDVGPNGLRDFPIIASVASNGLNSVRITGTACANCTVRIFRSTLDVSLYGEGQNTIATTSTDGAGAFSVVAGLSTGLAVTAVAVDSEGNQSEFARNVFGPQSITIDRTDDTLASACTSAANDCSLRGALTIARSGDTVVVDNTVFPTNTTTYVSVTSALPPLSAGNLAITTSSNNVARLGIDGTGAGSGVDGLRITSDGNTLTGIIVRNFSGNGFVITGSGNQLGYPDWESCDYSGWLRATSNGGYGFVVDGDDAHGNALSNLRAGISGQGNLLGGMLIQGAADNYLGNCFSPRGNTGPALTLRGVASLYSEDGSVTLNDNAGGGLRIESVSDIELGVSFYVSNNGSHGIVVQDSSGVRLSQLYSSGNTGHGLRVVNSQRVSAQNIYTSNNTGLAIDLVAPTDDGTGVTLNDNPSDGDSGANGLLNFPVINSVVADGNNRVLVRGTACVGCTVYLGPASLDPTGYGEMSNVSLRLPVATDGTFSGSMGLSAGAWVTAVALDTSSNMSECARAVQGPQKITVDRSDDTLTTTCSATANDCSFRGALTIAKRGDSIAFDTTVFPANPVKSVLVTTALPAIPSGITIEGARNGQPGVIIDGAATPAGTNGLTFSNNNSVVYGLIVARFPGDGIYVTGANNVISDGYCDEGIYNYSVVEANGGYGIRIVGDAADNNYVGMTYLGRAGSGNGLGGMLVAEGPDDTYVMCADARGNGGPGITVRGPTTQGFNLERATLGGSGTSRNLSHGLLLEDLPEISVSGASISGNQGDGVHVDDGRQLNLQVYVSSNAGDGVRVTGGATDVRVSGSLSSNAGAGLRVVDGLRVDFSSGSITNNGGLGIDLVHPNPGEPRENALGVNFNDRGDPDLGPNGLQNFPDARELRSLGDGYFTMKGVSCPGCVVRVWTQAIDPSGYGEASSLRSTTTADGNGIFFFGSMYLGLDLQNVRLTMTASRGGSISEFGEGEEAYELAQETAVCGNGILEEDEECDDHDLEANDGCSPACIQEVCGDGIRQTGENCDGDCDDGNKCTINDVCSSDCGNCPAGVPLDCDDGNPCTTDRCDPAIGCVYEAVSCPVDDDACTADICDTSLGCVHRLTPKPEVTDNSCNQVDDDCDTNTDEDYGVQSVTCGDGACAQTGTRICSPSGVVVDCTPLEPQVATDETCDGVDQDCDTLVDEEYLAQASCGECAVGVETCDNGTKVQDCSDAEPLPDGTRCNDGNATSTNDACFDALCTGCGNGKREANESCDDGNLATGDGCNNSCVVEDRWACNGALNALSTCACDASAGYLDDGTTPKCQRYDFGDAGKPSAPNIGSDTYGTSSARHVYDPTGPYIGTTLADYDFEVGGVASAEGDSDDDTGSDDEGAFVVGGKFRAGVTGTVSFPLTLGNASVAAIAVWVDFNRDGDFADPGELNRTFQSATTINMPMTAPSGAGFVMGPTMMRVRVGRSNTNDYITIGAAGRAPDGEVEDHLVLLGGCGDGDVDGPETCDDGNDDEGDGCSPTCTTEDGYACEGAPSHCVLSASLSVSAFAWNKTNAYVGETATLTFSVKNAVGVGTAKNTSVVLTVPFAFDEPLPAGCSQVATELSCTIGDVAANVTKTLAFTVTVPANIVADVWSVGVDGLFTNGTEVDTSAVVAAVLDLQRCGDGDIYTPEVCDTGATASAGCVACAVTPGWSCTGEPSDCSQQLVELDGTVSWNMASAYVGERPAVTIKVANGGPNKAHDVKVRFTLPPLDIQGFPGGCRNIAGALYECDLGDIAATQSAQTTFTLQVLNTVSASPATAAITQVSSVETDTNPTNDLGSADVTILWCGDGKITNAEICDDKNKTQDDGCTACAVDDGWECNSADPTVCRRELDLSISGAPYLPLYGTNIGRFDLTIRNPNLGVATNIVFEIPKVDGLEFTALPPICDGTDPLKVVCTLPSLAVNDTWAYQYLLRFAPGSTATSAEFSATIVAQSNPDPVASNNVTRFSLVHEFCGDKTKQTVEACDDPVANSNTATDTCRLDCTLPRCGDAVVDTAESCDDGGANPGDGCASCAVEPGFDCTGSPSDCSQRSVDLRVTSAFSAGSAYSLEHVDYTVSVNNNSVRAATNVVFTVPVPAALTFVSAPDGCVFASGVVTCTLTRIEPVATARVAIVLAPTLTPAIGNVAVAATSIDSPEYELNASNDLVGASANIDLEYCSDGEKNGAETCDDGNLVAGDGCGGAGPNACRIDNGWECSAEGSNCKPLVDLNIQAEDMAPMYGTNIGTFFMDPGNGSNHDAHNVVFEIPKSPELDYLPNGLCDPYSNATTIICKIDKITALQGFTRGFNVRFKPGSTATSVTQTATIVAQDNTDPNPGNNSATVTLVHEFCGDKTKQSVEACDDPVANSSAPDTCRTDCSLPRCGDGTKDSAEACDDGNGTLDDGCSSCVVDAGYDCSGVTPTRCVRRAVDVTSTTTFAHDAVYEGGTTTATITVTNNGSARATNVTATIALPPGTALTYVGNDGDCSAVGVSGACRFGALEAGASASVRLTFTVPMDVSTGSGALAVTGLVFPESDLNPANNTSHDEVVLRWCGDGTKSDGEACDDANEAASDGCSKSCVVEGGWRCTGQGAESCVPLVDLGVAGGSLSPVYGNGQATWTVQVGNASQFTATGVVVTLPRDPALDYLANVCDPTSDPLTIVCHIASIGPLSNTQLSFPVRFKAGSTAASATLTATITAQDDVDPSGGNDTISVTLQHQFCGDKTKQPNEACDDPVANSSAPNMCRTDCTLPRCGDGTVDSGELCDDNNPTSNDGCTSCVVDAGYDCQGVTPSTCLMRQVDLRITSTTFGADDVYSGEAAGLTVTVINGGTETATNVTAKVTLPATTGLTLVNNGGCTVASGVATCAVGTLTGGATKAIVFGFTGADAPSVGSVSATVTQLSSPELDGNPSNNLDNGSDTLAVLYCGDGVRSRTETCDDSGGVSNDGCSGATGAVAGRCQQESNWHCVGAGSGSCVPEVDLKVSAFSLDQATIYAGATTTLSATIANEGNGVANNVAFTINLPSGVSTTSLGAGCTGTGPVTCTTTSLAAGASKGFTIGLTGDGTRVNPTIVPAALTSQGFDVDASDNTTGSATFTVRYCGDTIVSNAETCDDGARVANDGCSTSCATENNWTCTGQPSSCDKNVDLRSTVSFNGDSAYAGGTATLTVDVHNNGPQTASNVVATIALPGAGGLILTDDGPCTTTGLTATCNIATLLNNATTTLTFTFNVPAAPTTKSISATVTSLVSDDFDTNAGNNGGTDTFAVQFCGDGEDNGDEECDAGNAQFGGGNANTPDKCRTTCLLPSCGDGVTDPADDEACDDGDDDTGDGCASCLVEAGYSCMTNTPSVCIRRAVDLSVTAMSFGAASAYQGGKAQLSTTVSNLGSDAASAVTVTIQLPNSALMTLDGSVADPDGADCTTSAGVATCVVDALAGLATKTFVFDLVVVASPNAGTATATALTLTSPETDETPANNVGAEDKATITIGYCADNQRTHAETCDDGNTVANDGCSATCGAEAGWTCPNVGGCKRNVDLETTSVAFTAEEAYAGGAATLDVVVRNNGPQTATGVVATIELPAGLTLVDDGACTTSGNVATCNVASLASGASATFTFTFSVSGTPSDTAARAAVTSLTSGDNDTNPGNASREDTLAIAFCGDGIKNGGEQCDDGDASHGNGNANTPNKCRVTCVAPTCGDKITDSTAGTSDGASWTAETCDDGDDRSAADGDSCPAGVGKTCILELCKPGVMRDGMASCDHPACVQETACAAGDVDGDGVGNAAEIACGSNALLATSTPSADDVLDVDRDGTLNCKDLDDDGDKASDVAELGNCANANGKNDATVYPVRDLCTGASCGAAAPECCTTGNAAAIEACRALAADRNCNLLADVGEGACLSETEDDCGDDFDNDGDDTIDCLDRDCVGDAACVRSDFDGDGVSNADEDACGTDPTAAGSVPADDGGDDLDGDGEPNCVDADDDGDDIDDTVETACGSDARDLGDQPSDVDGDDTCDTLDGDDDGDGWDDDDERGCGFDPADASSVPPDGDDDGSCDEVDLDDDGDGVSDDIELTCGGDPNDADVQPSAAALANPDDDDEINCLDADDDGDLVSDVDEGKVGSDPLIKDTDGDGLDDGEENADHDGVIDADETSPISKDTDQDGIDDDVELGSDYGDGVGTSPVDRDSDGDGLSDGQEDTNHNGRHDAGEVNPVTGDSDGDGTNDGDEVGCASDPLNAEAKPVDLDDNDECDGAQADGDGDGVVDGVETYCGFDANDPTATPTADDLRDTDEDGVIDCADADDDDDLVSDVDEATCGTDSRDGAVRPSDAGVHDHDEDEQLDCVDADDDGDGIDDSDEVARGTDPLDADSDDDGLSDGDELALGTNPNRADSDGDGVQDGTELGVTVGTRDTGPTFVPDADPESKTNPMAGDSDEDGVSDGAEDINGNGRVDDGDGDPSDPDDQIDETLDSDGDGLTDVREAELGTDPDLADSDGDGIDDGAEVEAGTDPLVAKKKAKGGCAGGDEAPLAALALLLAVVARRKRA